MLIPILLLKMASSHLALVQRYILLILELYFLVQLEVYLVPRLGRAVVGLRESDLSD